MKALLVLGFALWVNFERSSAEVRCKHSPSAWCSSVEAAVQCGVLQQCLEANFTRATLWQTADPVKVGLYYESLCPGCQSFITSMLYPTSVLLGDIMDLTLVPYGNAQETFDGKKYIFTCQHGEQECVGNMIEACLLNLTDSDAFLTIFCMESSGDPIKAAQSCVELFSPDLSWKRLMTCVNGDLGNQIMHQNALKTQALKPSHTYVPWITINGVHTEEIQDKAFSALVPLVCNLYKGEKPATCGGSGRHFKSYCHK